MRDSDAQEIFEILSQHLSVNFSEEYEGERLIVTATIMFDGDYIASDSFSLEQ